MSPLERVTRALEERGLGPVRNGMARCPAHEDRRPSLAVNEGADGRALLKCFGGCAIDKILERLNLTFSDLFWPQSRPHAPATPRPASGDPRCTTARPRRVAVYTYTTAQGEPIARKVRTAPKGFSWEVPDGRGGWRRAGRGEGNPAVLYRLPEVLAADHVHWNEGEKAADGLAAVLPEGHAATCPPTSAWSDEFAEVLRARHVTIWMDRDTPGREKASKAAAALRGVAASVRIVQSAVETEHADAFDHLEAGHVLEDAVPVELGMDLAEILGRIVAYEERYVAFPVKPHQPRAVALWTAHTYVNAQFEATPYLGINSPEKRSGKTHLLETLEQLAARPWRAVLPSEAVTYRKIQRDSPTLLLDEVDAIFGPKAREHEGLRALLNAGHRKGSRVSRCVGPKNELQDFETYCPKALAGIGDLPDTVADRSIPIRLRRRRRDEFVEKFRRREATQAAAPIRQSLVHWAAHARLGDARPAVPDELGDRAADCWEPLLAIADAAGGAWPRWAREAAVALHGAEVAEETVGVRLLQDVREVFRQYGELDAIATADLLEGLHRLEDSPWADWNSGAGLTKHGLAKLLRPYGVRPVGLRIGGKTPRGYRRADLLDAWARYLSEAAPDPQHRNIGAETGTCEPERPPDPQPVAQHAPDPPRIEAANPSESHTCCGVADRGPSARNTGAADLIARLGRSGLRLELRGADSFRVVDRQGDPAERRLASAELERLVVLKEEVLAHLRSNGAALS